MYFENKCNKLAEKHQLACATYEREIKILKSKLDLANSQMQQLKCRPAFSEHTRVQKQLIDANKEKTTLGKQVNVLKSEVRHGQNVIAAQGREIETLKKQLLEAKDTSSQHKTRLKDCEGKLKSALEERDKINEDSSKHISNLENDNAAFMSALEGAGKDLMDMHNENGKLREQVDYYLFQDVDERVMDMEEFTNEHRDKIMDRKMEERYLPKYYAMSTDKKKIKQMKQEALEADRENARLHRELRTLQDKVAPVYGKYNICCAELTRARDQVTALAAERDTHQREATRLKNELSRANPQPKKPAEEAGGPRKDVRVVKKKLPAVSESLTKETEASKRRKMMANAALSVEGRRINPQSFRPKGAKR